MANRQYLFIFRERVAGQESYRLGIQSLLSNTFSMIARAYGELDAHTLYTWSARNIVDQAQVNLWSTWSRLLSSLNVTESESKLESLGVSPSSARNIAKTFLRYFGPDARHHDNQLLDRSKEIPLSPMEKEMVKLEVTRPSDSAEVDLLDILRLVLGCQHAYQVWAELDKWIDESEREALLWWGYAEAAEIGMPVGYVILPGREGNIISDPSLSH